MKRVEVEAVVVAALWGFRAHRGSPASGDSDTMAFFVNTCRALMLACWPFVA